jgi:hypothetical protein
MLPSQATLERVEQAVDTIAIDAILPAVAPGTSTKFCDRFGLGYNRLCPVISGAGSVISVPGCA